MRKSAHYVLALLCELLVSELTDEAIEGKCNELLKSHDEFQPWCDDDGVESRWYVKQPEFVWGAVLAHESGYRKRPPKQLAVWLELVDAHFPSSPTIAKKTRERLLHDGKAWRTLPQP